MGLGRITAAFMLAAMTVLPGPVSAAQDSLDIDLKELHSGRKDNAKPRHHSGAKTSRRRLTNRTDGNNGRISVTSAQPCQLARDMSEKMGVLATSPTRIQGAETVSATRAGLNVTVACGLSRAELYTYERLLSRNGEQLLIFEGGESGERVVEKLANHLGLLFKKRDPDAETLPMTYIFAPFDNWPQELQLTILAAPDSQTR